MAKLNETFCYKSQNLSSIFWNIEYFRIRNILEYGIFLKLEYSWILILENMKVKRNIFYMSQNLSSIFWNLEYFRIWNILEYMKNNIFLKIWNYEQSYIGISVRKFDIHIILCFKHWACNLTTLANITGK